MRPLIVVLWVIRALAVLGVLWAASVIVFDLADRTDSWDGFGVFLGVLFGVPILIVGLAAHAIARTLPRRPRRGTMLALVFAGLWASMAIVLMVTSFNGLFVALAAGAAVTLGVTATLASASMAEPG